MLTKLFAGTYKLKIKQDDCRESYIPCRHGQIHDHGYGQFAVLVIGPAATPRAWRMLHRTLLGAGLVLYQDGDAEGSLLFDPANVEQSRLAIRVMKAHRAKPYSPKDQDYAGPVTCYRQQESSDRCENRAFTASIQFSEAK